MITLTLVKQPSVPLEAETISPDVVAGLSRDAIRALPVYLGKRQQRLDDFFRVEGEASDELELRGDAGKVKWIGRAMTRGRVVVFRGGPKGPALEPGMTIDGDEPDAQFGYEAAILGDVDGDGFDELLVSQDALGDGQLHSRARLYAGAAAGWRPRHL